jgi:hypothetical protein
LIPGIRREQGQPPRDVSLVHHTNLTTGFSICLSEIDERQPLGASE